MAVNVKQAKFKKALLTSDTITEAFKQVGIAEHTAYKYLADEELRKGRINGIKCETSKLYESIANKWND